MRNVPRFRRKQQYYQVGDDFSILTVIFTLTQSLVPVGWGANFFFALLLFDLVLFADYNPPRCSFSFLTQRLTLKSYVIGFLNKLPSHQSSDRTCTNPRTVRMTV